MQGSGRVAPTGCPGASSARVAMAGSTLAGVLALAACQQQTARTDLFAEAPPPAPAATSRLNVPVEFDYSSLLGTLEKVVPEHFGSLDSLHQMGLDPRKKYAFEAKRGPFTAFADGELLHLRATITYSGKGFYKPLIGPQVSAGCGLGFDPPRRLVVELTTPLTLTKDWHLTSKARIARLEPASSDDRDKCQVTVLRLDVTPQVMEAARTALSKHLKDIDRKVAGVDLRDRFAGWWGTLARPIRLRDGVWLVIAPQRVEMGKVTGDGHVLTVPVSVEARPRIVASADAPPIDDPTLPPLGKATGGADGFHVVVDGVVDYPTATQAINAALANKRIEKSGHSAVLKSVSVEPGPRGRLELTVAFAGDAKGTLRLSGTPVLDRASGEVAVPDLDFDLDTDNNLVNAYAWLKGDELRNTLREKAHVPIKPALDKGRELLIKGLNRDIGKAVQLSATVDDVAVRGLYATRGGLLVRAEANGHAGLAVTPGKAPAAKVAARAAAKEDAGAPNRAGAKAQPVSAEFATVRAH